MYYVVENKLGEIIAHSDNMEYILEYLTRLYTSEDDKRIQFTIKSIDSSDESDKLRWMYDECELEDVGFGIILTNWEKAMLYDYVNEYYETGKNKLIEIATNDLKYHGKEVNDNTIGLYLVKKYGQKYLNLVSYDTFVLSLGKDRLLEMCQDSCTTKHIYDMDKEYKRILLFDN